VQPELLLVQDDMGRHDVVVQQALESGQATRDQLPKPWRDVDLATGESGTHAGTSDQ
jgi:hypothetical protein